MINNKWTVIEEVADIVYCTGLTDSEKIKFIGEVFRYWGIK